MTTTAITELAVTSPIFYPGLWSDSALVTAKTMNSEPCQRAAFLQ